MTDESILASLVLERREQHDPNEGHVVMFTPPIDENYWTYRVVVGEGQAVVGFPKFGTVGIGFAREEDWNTNLPYTVDTEDIFEHIAHNKGDDTIAGSTVRRAIEMIQLAAFLDNDERTARHRDTRGR